MILTQKILLSLICIATVYCVHMYGSEGLLSPYPGYYPCIQRDTDAPPQQNRAGQGPCLLPKNYQDVRREVTYVVRVMSLADDLVSLTIDKDLENNIGEEDEELGEKYKELPQITPSPTIGQRAPTKPSTLKGLLQQFAAILAARKTGTGKTP